MLPWSCISVYRLGLRNRGHKELVCINVMNLYPPTRVCVGVMLYRCCRLQSACLHACVINQQRLPIALMNLINVCNYRLGQWFLIHFSSGVEYACARHYWPWVIVIVRLNECSVLRDTRHDSLRLNKIRLYLRLFRCPCPLCHE